MIYYCVWLFAQIILENFPISSSGHIKLLDQISKKFLSPIGFSINGESLFSQVDVLEHFAHGATLLVIVVFFFSRWFFLLKNIRRCWDILLKIIALGIIVDGITSLFYLIFHYYVNVDFFPVVIGFFITACLLLSLKFCSDKKQTTFNWRLAIFLGCAQGLALLPGISRLAITYVVARWFGISARRSFEISWLIVTPLLFAAFFNSIRLIIFKQQATYLFSLPVLLTFFVATGIAYYCFSLTARLAYAKKWWWFGVYEAVLFFVVFCR